LLYGITHNAPVLNDPSADQIDIIGSEPSRHRQYMC
jgi:hypothetical protein